MNVQTRSVDETMYKTASTHISKTAQLHVEKHAVTHLYKLQSMYNNSFHTKHNMFHQFINLRDSLFNVCDHQIQFTSRPVARQCQKYAHLFTESRRSFFLFIIHQEIQVTTTKRQNWSRRTHKMTER